MCASGALRAQATASSRILATCAGGLPPVTGEVYVADENNRRVQVFGVDDL
jgi:hypothetical protein